MIDIAYFCLFFLMAFACYMSNPEGGVEYDMIQQIATRGRDAFVFGSDFGYRFRVF